MNSTNVSFKLKIISAAIIFAGFAACNNDNTGEAANNSPADTTMRVDSPNAGSAAGTSAPAKKKGKVAVTVKEDDATVKIERDKAGYYNRTEVAPAFPGGQSSLDNYINDNIQYPETAIDNNTEGTVYVQFAVDENGNISNVTTTGAKLGYGLEEEAIKVVSKMPKWTPGQVKGKNVKTWRTLPISYRLES